MKIYVRNVTNDTEMELNLPMQNLNSVLDTNCEYIIMESETLKLDEFDSIYMVNDFLEGCRQNGISEEELAILSQTYLYDEVVQMVVDGTYCIIDFDAETSGWYGGNGGDFTRDFDKGMAVYDFGFYKPFAFEVTEEIYDWIDWESVWTNANCDGWRTVFYERGHYLVHR